MHEKTAQYIRRGYPLSCFGTGGKRAAQAGIPVDCPRSSVCRGGTGRSLCNNGLPEWTFHFRHQASAASCAENTDLAADYAAGKFEVLEQEAYLTLVIDCLRRFRPDLVIHRVTGDGPGIF